MCLSCNAEMLRHCGGDIPAQGRLAMSNIQYEIRKGRTTGRQGDGATTENCE